MALEVRDAATGKIKPWVWISAAGLAIMGVFMFFANSSSSGGSSAEPITSEGLGGGGGLDALQQALETLNDRIDNLNPEPTNPTSGSMGGTSGIPAAEPRPNIFTQYPSTPPSAASAGAPIIPKGTKLPIYTQSAGAQQTSTQAVPTGSINPYPVSVDTNPSSPEATRRSPVRSDI